MIESNRVIVPRNDKLPVRQAPLAVFFDESAGICHNPFVNNIFGEKPFARNSGARNFPAFQEFIHLCASNAQVFSDFVCVKHLDHKMQIPGSWVDGIGLVPARNSFLPPKEPKAK
jgi:hypothetical protein